MMLDFAGETQLFWDDEAWSPIITEADLSQKKIQYCDEKTDS